MKCSFTCKEAEAATGVVLQKKLFLEISQISQEIAGVRASFSSGWRPNAPKDSYTGVLL